MQPVVLGGALLGHPVRYAACLRVNRMYRIRIVFVT
eukprot:COSAG02_NODE_47496_length_340_cov_1.684647_1_plen_35_part_10